MKENKKEIIRSEFINLLKDYPNFPIDNQLRQVAIASEVLEAVFEKTKIYLPVAEKEVLLQELLESVVFGLKGLQRLQNDPEIEEIMINGLKDVFIKKRFKDSPERVEISFKSEAELNSVIEKLLQGTGRRVDRSSPLVDVRLKDGSRVNIIIEPLSLNGPCITIRKFPQNPIEPKDLVKLKTINQEIHDFLKEAVLSKFNIIVSGGTAAGKTTTLSALTHFIKGGDQGDRVVVIEETAEIRLPIHITNQINLEARPPNVEGRGEYTIRDLLRNTLRMRPDRIIVGEARGGEAFDMLQAMNTGHPGSFTTLHANSAEDALSRIEALVLLAGFGGLPLDIVRKWIINTIDLLIHQQRMPDGTRRIVEICGLKKDGELENIFFYKNGGFESFEKLKFKYQERMKDYRGRYGLD